MKITHAKFLKLLAAELEQDEKITGIHLNGLISEIINTTAEGKPYEVPGFGTFKLFDGQMMFTADARLAAEINYNYEGMPEIDVNEARSIVDEELDEQDGTPVIKSDTLIEGEGVAGEEVPSPQDEDSFADLDDESYQDEATSENDEPEISLDDAFDYSDMQADADSIDGDAFECVSDLNMEGDADNAAVSKPLPSDRKKGESNVLLMLTIAAAVVLVAVGVWWYIGSRVPLPTAGVLPEAGLSQAMLDEVSAMEQEPVTLDVSAPDEPEPSEADRALAAMTNWEEPRPVGSPAPVYEDGALGAGPAEGAETGLDGIAGASTSPFGLRGQPQPMEGRVFSIVVHSLPSRIDGNIQCDEIARLGLRCLVVEARVDNRITYRVGIGQFQTHAEAQRRVEDLPEPYRSTNFPARIN